MPREYLADDPEAEEYAERIAEARKHADEMDPYGWSADRAADREQRR